jgi:hypothetical protein
MRDERQAEEWDRREVVSAFVSETRDASAGLTGPRVLVAVLAIALAAACAVAFGLLTRHASPKHAALGLRPVVHGSPPASWAGSRGPGCLGSRHDPSPPSACGRAVASD